MGLSTAPGTSALAWHQALSLSRATHKHGAQTAGSGLEGRLGLQRPLHVLPPRPGLMLGHSRFPSHWDFGGDGQRQPHSHPWGVSASQLLLALSLGVTGAGFSQAAGELSSSSRSHKAPKAASGAVGGVTPGPQAPQQGPGSPLAICSVLAGAWRSRAAQIIPFHSSPLVWKK